MAWQLAQQLDRGRPLWHMTFVDGVRLPEYPRGTVALVATIHHAAIDGVSGAEILGALSMPHHCGEHGRRRGGGRDFIARAIGRRVGRACDRDRRLASDRDLARRRSCERSP